MPFHAVHTPIVSPEKLVKHFEKKPKPENATETGGHKDPAYAGMLTEMDSAVGKILSLLKKLNLEEKTIVIFYSDNGGLGGYADSGIYGGKNVTDNKPLRGGKGMLYEGGIRVPLIIRWKGKIQANSLCQIPILSVDFYPTILEVTKAPKPEQILDGQSLVEIWNKSDQSEWKKRPLYWHFPGYLQADVKTGTWRTTPAGAIRFGDYKLIEFFETGKKELYHLKNDIGETKDLSKTNPKMTSQLYEMLLNWRKGIGAPMPEMKL